MTYVIYRVIFKIYDLIFVHKQFMTFSLFLDLSFGLVVYPDAHILKSITEEELQYLAPYDEFSYVESLTI